MAHRTLTLRTEHLAELTTSDLIDVVAGGPDTKSCPDHTYYCITGPAMCDRLSRICP